MHLFYINELNNYIVMSFFKVSKTYVFFWMLFVIIACRWIATEVHNGCLYITESEASGRRLTLRFTDQWCSPALAIYATWHRWPATSCASAQFVGFTPPPCYFSDPNSTTSRAGDTISGFGCWGIWGSNFDFRQHKAGQIREDLHLNNINVNKIKEIIQMISKTAKNID